MAIYDTGTVTFSGTTVNGSGVNWQTANNPVRPGNTLLVMPANEAFTVVRINSATQLVVNRAPTKAISNSAYCLLLTDALSNDALAQRVSEMTRYYEQQVNAWGQLITASEDVSIVGPDGSAVKVPSLKKLYDGLGAKADKSELEKKADKAEVDKKANKSDLGNSASRNIGTAAGTIAAGDDVRLGTINNKTGGLITSAVRIQGTGSIISNACTGIGWDGSNGVSEFVNNRGQGTGGFRYRIANATGGLVVAFSMSSDGNAYAANGRWIEKSDARIKDNIRLIENPLEKMKQLRGYTWNLKWNGNPGAGFIAQEVQQVFPELVIVTEDMEMRDGTVVEGVLAPDNNGISAGLHHEAILALMEKVEQLEAKIAAIPGNLTTSMKQG